MKFILIYYFLKNLFALIFPMFSSPFRGRRGFLIIQFQHRQKRLLRHFHIADLFHSFFTFFLFL